MAGGSSRAPSSSIGQFALTLALCVLLSDSGQQQPSSVGNQSHSASDPGPIRATAPMWRCSRIMHMQRELHPTLLSSLEGIVDQMVWFRENWHEEVLLWSQDCVVRCVLCLAAWSFYIFIAELNDGAGNSQCSTWCSYNIWSKRLQKKVKLRKPCLPLKCLFCSLV